MTTTFHESYGTLPVDLLRLIQRYNVAPADYALIESIIPEQWEDIAEHINRYSARGYYVPPFPFTIL